MPLQFHHTSLIAGAVEEKLQPHDLWVIADQDCDLAWRAILDDATEPFLVELRPVLTEDPPLDWGIRSQKFLLHEDGRHVHANVPSIRVTPEVVAAAEHVDCLDAEHQLRMKTWLGLRYDRPAVPQRYMELAKALAEALAAKKNRQRAERYRDVLAQYWEEAGATKYTLVAVLPGGPYAATSDDVIDARNWLAECVLGVDEALGASASLEAYGDDEISLQYVEGSFSVDLSRLSWPPNQPGPKGRV